MTVLWRANIILMWAFVFGGPVLGDDCVTSLTSTHESLAAPVSHLRASAPVDVYQNYADLLQSNTEGVDFRIIEEQRGSPITVIAPHAGKIEPGTTEIARELAGNFFNLYLFEGIRDTNNFELHITSHHFDEPRALALMRNSSFGLSIHAYFENKYERICVGGRNTSLASVVSTSLQELGFEIEFPCMKYKGQSFENIVNRASYFGVQLEFSTKLLSSLSKDPDRVKELARAIRQTLGAPLQ